jgi:hypothetical protein
MTAVSERLTLTGEQHMKRVSTRLLALTFVLTTASSAAAQTADEVVEKSLTAMGGRAALGKLTTRSSSGTMTVSTPGGDISGTVESLNAVPNKSRTLITLDLSALGAGSVVLDQRCDGTSGYSLDSMRGNSDITGRQLDLMKQNYFPTPLLDYKAHGLTVELAGTEQVAGRPAHVLKVTSAAGTPSRMFIDAESYLPVQSVVTVDLPEVGELEQTLAFSDYRAVDGVQVPFTVKGSSAVQTFTIALSTVEHNVKVDESLFSKPAAR